MRAFHITAPGEGTVVDVPPPRAGAGEVVVRTLRAGICGTDVGLFNDSAERMRARRNTYPMQPGHEWCGVVEEVGTDVDHAWRGARVTGDTMIGCGTCAYCRAGRHHVCPDRYEIGVRRGLPGSFAERFCVPAIALRRLPATVDDAAGSMVEPGGNALRAVDAAIGEGAAPMLIIGAGTIGLLAALLAKWRGADAVLVAKRETSLELAQQLGIRAIAEPDGAEWASVIDCTDDPSTPARALDLVMPTGRVVLMGVAHAPSLVDTRVALRKEATLVGILGASAGLDDVIAAYASGEVDPRPLISRTIGLGDIGSYLSGTGAPRGARPKTLIDPML